MDKSGYTHPFFRQTGGGGKMQTSSPPVITPNRSQSNPDAPTTHSKRGHGLARCFGHVYGPDSAAGKKGSTGHPLLSDNLVGIPTSATIFILHPLLSTFSSTFVRNIPTFDHSSTLKRRPQTPATAADLVWVCAPPRTIRKWLRRLAFVSCGPGRKIFAAAAADLVWVCAPPRTNRKWLRRLAFWILRTRAQDPRSCCCRPGVGLRPVADHPQMVTTPGVLDPADPGAISLQLLLQTWCGSAPRRGPSANGYDAWGFGSCGPARKILAAAA